ncbi:FliH/SctL family protein [Zhongshania guokunii]|uniref:Flagellar assembly protein FliH n=1 Tax=Zhongshania guokunii TaxID=641783 RepID=A0ABV3U2W4_9GAMM
MADVFQVFVPRVIETDGASDSSAVTDSSDNAQGYQSWKPPEVNATSIQRPHAEVNTQRSEPMVNEPRMADDTIVAEDVKNAIEMQRKQAYDAGFQQGMDDAKQESQRLLAEQSQQLQLALAALREPQKWIDSELERELFLMTLAISKQLLRHELSLRPELIENLIHKAVAALPLSNGGFEIFLNPEDAEVLRGLHEDRNEPLDPAWRLIEDPAISRGGCRINSDHSRIDEQLETRIQHVVAEMLGETMVPQRAADTNERGVSGE